MTQSYRPPTSSAPAPLSPPVPPPQGSRFDVKRLVLIGTGAIIGLLLVLIVIAFILSRPLNSTFGEAIETLRDIVIIFLALEGILIVLALAILILQFARLINLLQNDVKPVLKDTQATLRSARGTVDFVGDTVSRPIITAGAFLAGVGAFARDVGGIRRAVKRTAESLEDAAHVE